MGWLPALVLSVPTAALLAWWPWRGSLGSGAGLAGLASRFLAVMALLLLVLDPGLRGRRRTGPPLVLLDRSISMLAGGRVPDALAAQAAARGDTISFGTIAPGEPAGPTLLADALTGAVGGGRPVVVLTDGEIADVALVPADILARVSVELTPRPAGPDVALASVRAPSRLAVGDTLAIELELVGQGVVGDTVVIVVREGETELHRASTVLDPSGRARLRLARAWPADRTGSRWLEVIRAGDPDAEPGNDVRWLHVDVAPSPGVVFIATTPDWDARALYRALRDVTDAPVRGYTTLETGAWRRMDDLRSVGASEVRAAARAADLLVVRGDSMPWRTLGRARWWWPSAAEPGDWYADAGGVSPLGTALAGVGLDSLAPLTAVAELALPPGTWVAMSARRARRGTAVPVLAGREQGGARQAVLAGQGLYRWGFRGGASEQAWRSLVAGTAGWLLAAAPASGARAVPTQRVTPRGQPVRFRWAGQGTPEPLPITVTGDGPSQLDTLRFDAEGNAMVVLPVGRYTAVVDGLDAGALGVEPFSDEFLGGPVTLTAREATVEPVATRRTLRDLLPLFLLAVAGFSAEWLLRRRLGLR